MAESLSFTFGRHERLKSQALITELFEKGSVVSKYPLRFTYLVLEKDTFNDSSIKVSINAGKKGLRLAVKRNRMKRILRELYRHHKHPLMQQLQNQGRCLSLSVVYVGTHLMEYDAMEKVYLKLLMKLTSALKADVDAS
jgi:ribonuclease P protein component